LFHFELVEKSVYFQNRSLYSPSMHRARSGWTNEFFMANLQDLINLAKADGGKFFVIDETGDAKLVIMSVEDYQRLLLGKLQRQVMDVESINKEILKAQLEEESPAHTKGPTISNRPPVREPRAAVDLRAEVIDPSFDFEGPRVEIDDL
jgi:hypothetical protein